MTQSSLKPSLVKYAKLLLFAFSCLIVSVYPYLQFTLYKNRQPQSSLSSKSNDDCITKNTFKPSFLGDSQELQYEQLCYFKDITYYIELFHENRLHRIGVDLTAPFSWLKSDHCKVVETGKACSLIGDRENKKSSRNKKVVKRAKDESQADFVESSKKRKDEGDQKQQDQGNKKQGNKNQQSQTNKNEQKQNKKNNRHTQRQDKENKLARIQGSNQLVQGFLQQNKAIQFWTKDSGRLSRLIDVLMLGFYMVQQKQKVSLQKTNFINTTKLSQNMNQLQDGALSLRFDDSSQNSFLQQIFQYTQAVDKMITIYINGDESTLTIGELSIKNTAEGYSGIVWVPFDNSQDNTAYGKLPLVQAILLQSLAKDQEESIEKDDDNSVFMVLSLSASYIGLPQIAINELSRQFSTKYGLLCSVSQHSYFECNFTHSKSNSLTQNLLFAMKQGAISLPMDSLILKQSKRKLTLNLRLISKLQNQKFKSFIILGQPYFQKYFTALDYRNNRLGFALKRTAQHNNFISTVSLIRFVSFLFFTGCCFLICFQPLKKMFEAFKGRSNFYNRKSPEGRRLKYEPIDENPYEEIAGTLRTVMENGEQNS